MRNLCLDVGNVLFNMDMEPFLKALSKQMNLSREDSMHFINRIQRKQDLGITSIQDELVTLFNIKSEYIVEDLIEAWNLVLTANLESITSLFDVADSMGMKIAILSNIGFEHKKHIQLQLGRLEHPYKKTWNAAVHHFSCDVGARKPTYMYFKSILEMHPEFEGAFYIDDLKDNLDGGALLGLKPFQFDLSKINVCDIKDTVQKDIRKFFEENA